MEYEMNNFEVEGTLERMKMIKRGAPLSTLWPSDIDTILNALEKQSQKKPVYDETIRKNGKKVRYHIICPGCYSFSPGIGDEHCVKCGQAIDWSEWDEDK